MHGVVREYSGGDVLIFDDGDQLGDPYVDVIHFEQLDAATVEVKGRVGPVQPSVWRAAARAFRAKGWRVLYRRNSGATRGTREAPKGRQ